MKVGLASLLIASLLTAACARASHYALIAGDAAGIAQGGAPDGAGPSDALDAWEAIVDAGDASLDGPTTDATELDVAEATDASPDACPEGLSLCIADPAAPTCVNLSFDPLHCGACAVQCRAPEGCLAAGGSLGHPPECGPAQVSTLVPPSPACDADSGGGGSVHLAASGAFGLVWSNSATGRIESPPIAPLTGLSISGEQAPGHIVASSGLGPAPAFLWINSGSAIRALATVTSAPTTLLTTGAATSNEAGTSVASAPLLGPIRNLVLSYDNTTLYFLAVDTIYAMPVTGGVPTALATTVMADQGLYWASAGDQFVYAFAQGAFEVMAVRDGLSRCDDPEAGYLGSSCQAYTVRGATFYRTSLSLIGNTAASNSWTDLFGGPVTGATVARFATVLGEDGYVETLSTVPTNLDVEQSAPGVLATGQPTPHDFLAQTTNGSTRIFWTTSRCDIMEATFAR